MNRKFIKNKIECIESKLCAIKDAVSNSETSSIEALVDIEALLAKSSLAILESEANDLVKTFAYLDAGTADERVSTITYTSATDFPTLTVVKTFVYAGSSGSYRVSTITLS